MDFSQWSRNEIQRLRQEAVERNLQADSLEQALNKYEAELKTVSPPKTSTSSNGHVAKLGGGIPKRRSTKKGDKAAFAAQILDEANSHGASLDEMFAAFVERWPSYKRSSLRSLVFHQKKEGNFAAVHGGRVALKKYTSGPHGAH